MTNIIDILFLFFYLDYQTCVQNGNMIQSSDKSFFCPNFYYVFYAELELNLNRYFTISSREQWSLLFVDYNFMPPVNINNDNFNEDRSILVFKYQPHILTILHNAKIKYCCLPCQNEWTTARGRVIFQAEVPEINKYNVLFGYLFTQKCRICHRDTEPSWYLDEATRIMKNVCRILIENFYSNRQLLLSSPSSSSEEDDVQRASHMRNRHHRDLCRACQEGSCYGLHGQYQQRR